MGTESFDEGVDTCSSTFPQPISLRATAYRERSDASLISRYSLDMTCAFLRANHDPPAMARNRTVLSHSATVCGLVSFRSSSTPKSASRAAGSLLDLMSPTRSYDLRALSAVA